MNSLAQCQCQRIWLVSLGNRARPRTWEMWLMLFVSILCGRGWYVGYTVSPRQISGQCDERMCVVEACEGGVGDAAWVDKRGRGPKPDSEGCWDIFDSRVEFKVPFRVNDHNKEIIIRKWSWTRCVKVPDEMMINPLSPIFLITRWSHLRGAMGHNTWTQVFVQRWKWWLIYIDSTYILIFWNGLFLSVDFNALFPPLEADQVYALNSDIILILIFNTT